MHHQHQNSTHQKNLFLETDLALHEHCQNCVIVSIPAYCDRYGCKIICCPHECGHRFHSCKTEEHLLLCPLVKTPCINAIYGCPLWMHRQSLGPHLAKCPASVVYCNMERNRKPLKCFGKMLKRRDGKIDDDRFGPDHNRSETDLSDDALIDVSDHRIGLDLALAYSDQRQINNLYRLPRSRRKTATNFFNKRHPALPLLPNNKIDQIDRLMEMIDDADQKYRENEGDSSDDEAATRRRNASIVSPVARECILCKIDPSSQHLHQLRGAAVTNADGASPYMELDNIELDENANESLKMAGKSKSWSISTEKGASFYADRGLLIDLSSDFLPMHYPKCGSYYTIVCDQSMRRDEYGDHFENFHNDIIDGLDGWTLVRCPLWQYGCGCYATRLEPGHGHGNIIYNSWRDTFAIKYTDQQSHRCDHLPEIDSAQKSVDSHVVEVDGAGQSSGSLMISQMEQCDQKSIIYRSPENESDFIALPLDLICAICSMLDSSSLFCLGATCRTFNDFIRCSLLPTRGLVERPWIKMETKTDGGRARWMQGAKQWRLSKSFQPIRAWRMKSIGKFVDHIQKCPYYEPLVHKEKKIPVLTFAKPFVHRPSRRDMYRGVALENQDSDQEDDRYLNGDNVVSDHLDDV